MRRRLIGAAVAGITLAALVIGIRWWNRIDHQLSLRPPQGAKAQPIPTTISTISTTVTIPYDTIRAALNQNAPAQYDGSGRQNVCVDINETVQKEIEETIGGDVGKVIGAIARTVTTVVTVNQLRHVCQDVDYQYFIKRQGAITIDPIPGGLRLTVPVAADGVVGFSGDIAKAVALDRKNFRGSIIATADVALDIGTDWCPQVSVNPSFAWTDKAQLEIAHKFWINIDSSAEPQIRKLLEDLTAQIPSVIKCESIQAAVGPLFAQQLLSLDTLPPNLIYVNIVPQKAGFSGLQYDADAVRLALSISASTEINTSRPLPIRAAKLPPLERIPASTNTIDVSLPLRLGYAELGSHLTNALAGRTFSAQSKIGPVSVQVSGVEIYPSAESLVIGLQFSARVPGRFLNTRGTVYLIAKPALDVKDQLLRITGVSFTRDLDNELWSVVSAVFRGQIQKEVEAKARFDLRPAIDLARNKLQEETVKLSAQPPHLHISISDSVVGLKRVVLAPAELNILASFQGTASVTIPIEAVPKKAGVE
jgi:hypothetical protein